MVQLLQRMCRAAAASQCGVVDFVLLPCQRHLHTDQGYAADTETGVCREQQVSLKHDCGQLVVTPCCPRQVACDSGCQQLAPHLDGHVQVVPADRGTSVHLLSSSEQVAQVMQLTRGSSPRLLQPPIRALASA